LRVSARRGEFLDKIFKALSDESRRKIISMLVEKDRSVNEIAKNFNKTQPCISHHLEVLKNAGIVESRKEGKFTIYSINMSSIQYIINWFMGLKDNK
jgi:DNA-binding transcriptional ArsR family regulator